MALRPDFYSEIFEQEKKWIELIDSKLLNSIYCKYILQPFYLAKKKDLEQEYLVTKNVMIGYILGVINPIIQQIELFNNQFKSGEKSDISTLLPLFLTNQMSNNKTKEEEKNNPIREEITGLQIRKQLLESQMRNYDRIESTYEDYVYDDFPEEVGKIK